MPSALLVIECIKVQRLLIFKRRALFYVRNIRQVERFFVAINEAMQRAVAVILVIKQDEFDFERRMERVLHSDFLRDERPHGGRKNGDPGIGLKQGDDRVIKVAVGECALRLPRYPLWSKHCFSPGNAVSWQYGLTIDNTGCGQ